MLPGRVRVHLVARSLLHQTSRSFGLDISSDGKKLNLSDSNASFHAVWLRHNCNCKDCLTSSGQKSVTGKDLIGDLRISHSSINGDEVMIKWKEDNDNGQHTGYLSLQWLMANTYTVQSLEKRSTDLEPIAATKLPFVKYTSVMDSDEGLWKWLRYLNYYGLSLVTGVPTGNLDIKKVCERISHLQKTIYGEIFDVKSETNPINIAYTNVHIDFHMDLGYYQSPPGLQALHCLRNDSCIEGGESILLDSYAVVKEMRKTHPQQFETLTRIPATFQKIHFERESPVVMVYKRPHIVLDRTGRIIKINWSPAFEGPLAIPENEVEEYYEAYTLLDKMFNTSPLKITHRLNSGEMLIFNNQRILHSRLSFVPNGGVRHLRGAYVNIDEFHSRFSVLSNLLGKQIYFAGSIRGGRSDVTLYHRIVKLLQKYGTVLTEHVGDSEIDEKGDSHLTDKEIYDRDMDWLRSTDVLVAEVTQPSLGVGYEIGRAFDFKLKVLCLFRPESGRKLSALIRGAENESTYTVVDYKTEDIDCIIDNYFKKTT